MTDAFQTTTFTNFDEIPTPSRLQRMKDYGIDATELVHFTRWETGGEYVKHITVKNVFLTTQKISYVLPKSKIFSMEFPDVKTLSRGMTWTIPITFRPVAKVKRKITCKKLKGNL